jgi:hypothetical protein
VLITALPDFSPAVAAQTTFCATLGIRQTQLALALTELGKIEKTLNALRPSYKLEDA